MSDYFRPKTWPLFWRRLFVLTLPVSGPLWVVSIVVIAVVMMPIAMVAIGFCLLVEGVILPLWRQSTSPASANQSSNPQEKA